LLYRAKNPRKRELFAQTTIGSVRCLLIQNDKKLKDKSGANFSYHLTM